MGAVSQGGIHTNASGVPKWRRDSGAGAFQSRPRRSDWLVFSRSQVFLLPPAGEGTEGRQLQCDRQIKVPRLSFSRLREKVARSAG
ncbi:hypothetical protein [Xanthomonas euvesicatoria]|uniref:hypothetical protein n=1 Tax=Xanthomonas euvesicatoria TaxID=456327 RepID=UPI001C4673BD|nr:hypothetical protein [Xanthomonas euvesicatoria]MBV6870369.1 hypothetical protein [Xanthomonas campestris pv. veroniae]